MNMKSKCDACGGTRRMVRPAHEGVFMGQTFPIAAKEVACTHCSVFHFKAIRKNNVTKERREVDCTVEVSPPWPGSDRWCFSVSEGGITGYESIYLDGMMDPRGTEIVVREGGWWANAGGMGRDGLLLRTEDLNRAFEHMQLEGFHYGS